KVSGVMSGKSTSPSASRCLSARSISLSSASDSTCSPSFIQSISGPFHTPGPESWVPILLMMRSSKSVFKRGSLAFVRGQGETAALGRFRGRVREHRASGHQLFESFGTHQRRQAFRAVLALARRAVAEGAGSGGQTGYHVVHG